MNLGSPKLILFPQLGQEDSNVVLEMSIVCKPSGPEKWGEVTIGERAGRCVRKGKWSPFPTRLPHPARPTEQGSRRRRSLRSEGRPGNDLQELALISTNRLIVKSDCCISGNSKRCGPVGSGVQLCQLEHPGLGWKEVHSNAASSPWPPMEDCSSKDELAPLPLHVPREVNQDP